MVISQLPHIEIPSEETLNDEDNHIIQAFDIILNGYKRSQNRLHAISKAYIELKSIAQTLVEDNEKNDKPLSKTEEETLDRDNNTGRELLPLQLHGNDSRDNILTVDLTYDFEDLEQSPHSGTRASSPIFGQQRKKSKKNCSSDEANSFGDFIKKNKEKNEAGPLTKIEANQDKNISIYEATKDNEENLSPVNKLNFQSSKLSPIDAFQRVNESQTVAKIGFSKTVYNISQLKTSDGKRLRQATLVFQPQTSKANVSNTKKSIKKPKDCHLFDENYRNTKKPTKNKCKPEQENPEIFYDTERVNEKSIIPCSAKLVASSVQTTKSDEAMEVGKNSTSRKKDSLIIETPSQIDETARSLFDDEDLEEFDASKDLLNTCLDSPSIVENVVQSVTVNNVENRDKNVDPIASTSKLQFSQFSCAMDSIDETFFAPVEMEMPKKKVEKPNSKPDCSTSTQSKDCKDKNRNLNKKSNDQTVKELGDFEVQDIDWDQDITTDNWPPPKRPLNDDSFDFVPKKKKKSPNFAYKGKVERKHAERAKLPGWDCKDCEKYYGTMNLPEEELKNHMNRCSRHRSKYNPRYFTPKNFWNPVFPDATDSSDFSDDELFEKRKKPN